MYCLPYTDEVSQFPIQVNKYPRKYEVKGIKYIFWAQLGQCLGFSLEHHCFGYLMHFCG